MYGFLEARFGRVTASVLTGAWYAFLIVLVVYCAFEPRARFSYLML